MNRAQSKYSRKQKRSSPKPPRHVHKKQKTGHQQGSSLLVDFWNNLSKIWLTDGALQELDRRSTLEYLERPIVFRNPFLLRPVTRTIFSDIQNLAKEGGPDLSDLRGYPDPTMSPRQSSQGRKRKRSTSTNRRDSQSVKSSTSKNIGPYHQTFQQHLIDHGIYPHLYKFLDGSIASKPSNWNEIVSKLSRRRGSLSSSTFKEDNFEEFLRADVDAPKEMQVAETVILFIEGKVPDNKCVCGALPFYNLDPLTAGNPDRYYGSRPEALNRQIRLELGGQIVPSQHDLPIVPNFFLAVKGPDGLASVAKRQALYDSVLGARGIHSLRKYGGDDGNLNKAYTISTTYLDGTLKMYTCHQERSTASGTPKYYMTLINSWAMTGNIKAFREGATWFRNGLDWAAEQREDAIKRANEHEQDRMESSSSNDGRAGDVET